MGYPEMTKSGGIAKYPKSMDIAKYPYLGVCTDIAKIGVKSGLIPRAKYDPT